MNRIVILLLCVLFSSTSHASFPEKFCKADLNGPDSPSGYLCLPSETVTAADFKYTFNGKAGILVPPNTLVFPATVAQYPILNGLGISGAIVEIPEGGILPVHDHDATEIVLVIEGQIDVGILTPRKAFRNKLTPGDVFLFPKGLLHYLINSGRGKAVAFAAFSSPNPSFRFLYEELFTNDVPSITISQISFLDVAQVRKLKARFNGTG
ncbi:hypothetical protein LR48_Vigan2406s000100 [Vigna angularis]|nr:Auxin-binding protein [Vigna angularis]KAG2380025.1 Auxin-binding protein [Vigna angularis]KOM24664.1 hypothetical protein LR48_Vigan2406s000100 [Vigna angularis]